MLSLAPLSKRLSAVLPGPASQAGALPNIIIILFDAFSAQHLPIEGYPRPTTPNLDRFARRATVYHNHHSAGNFTTSSTASLFTGSYPWIHRAFSLNSLISAPVESRNIFRLLSGVYYQAAFGQNPFADTLLYQFDQYLNRHEGSDSFSLFSQTYYNHLFENDAVYGITSVDRHLFDRGNTHASLFLSLLNDWGMLLRDRLYTASLASQYPDGLPRLDTAHVYFTLDRVMDGLMGMLDELPQPFFTYLHIMPPHGPYRPTSQFFGMFADEWKAPTGKKHPLAPGIAKPVLRQKRRIYDEFIANTDHEFGRLLDHMDSVGLLDNSYVILTSDHGQLFEKGAHGHTVPLVFEPVIKVPLIISTPGQRQREDIHALTSNVDLLPTLLNIANLPIPDWAQGQVLPGLGGEESPDRSIYMLEAKQNPSHSVIRRATLGLIKGQYKFVHYFGYPEYGPTYELYDLQNDPLENENLFPSHPMIGDFKAELDQVLQDANQPYVKG